MSSIGIMDPAFFVGKAAILKWMNDFFGFGYVKIEQCASGAAHCQVLDAIFPGKVPLGKVNFNAKYDYEFVKNWKVLQDVFNKEQISKHVDVQKLVKAKYQDNLEFCQWIKNFFELRYAGQEYDSIARREQAMNRYNKKNKHSGRTRKTINPSRAAAAKAAKEPATSTTRTTRPKPSLQKENQQTNKMAGSKSGNGALLRRKNEEIKDLNEENAKLRLSVDGLEKERNFYFGKLREIEILCQADDIDAASVREKVLAILYQTDDKEEFQAPEEETAAVSVQ